MLRRGLVALLLGVVATVFEPAVGFFLIPSSKAVVGRAREQHHQPLTAAGVVVAPAKGAGRRRGRAVEPLRMAAEADAEAGKVEEEMQKIKPMKIREIKEELDERGVGYQDLLEKAEFTRRLAEARVKGITKPPPAPAEEEPAPSAASAGPTAGEASTASTSSSGSSGPSASASAGAGEKKSEEAKAVDEAARYEKALEEIMKMRVSEIKQELDLLKVSHKGLFEKREFAEALAKARLAPENRGANVDPDDDPSEYRTVKVTRMPRDDKGAAGGPGAGAGPGAGGPRGGPGAGGPFGGAGGDPFSSIFNQAGGARGARGGAGGPGGFGSMFDGFGGAGGPFGGAGAGGGMGGFDPSILQKVMSNPRAAAAFQRAQSNPRIMAAVQEMAKNPSVISKYMNDPEIASVLKELQSVFR